MKKDQKVVSLDHARWLKKHDEKEDKVTELAERFELALPSKATPVKDFLNNKRNKKKKNKNKKS